jgi:hypothetical protein
MVPSLQLHFPALKKKEENLKGIKLYQGNILHDILKVEPIMCAVSNLLNLPETKICMK